MPCLGEEAPIGEDLMVSVVGRVLQEHVDVVRLITQPGEERDRRVERPPFDVGLTKAR